MLLNAEEIKNLKARVKAECQRRAFEDSVASYGDTSYDYSEVPASGIKIKKEHYDKIATPLNAINANKITTATAGDGKIVSRADYTSLEGFVSLLEKRVQTDTSASDCKGGCAGLCYSTCTGGCSNGCSGTCESTCSGGCTSCSSCTGSCSGCTGCSGCSGTCTDACTSCTSCTSCTGCSGGCGGTCKGSCSGGCQSTCKGSCTDACTNICAQMCSTNCDTDAML